MVCAEKPRQRQQNQRRKVQEEFRGERKQSLFPELPARPDGNPGFDDDQDAPSSRRMRLLSAAYDAPPVLPANDLQSRYPRRSGTQVQMRVSFVLAPPGKSIVRPNAAGSQRAVVGASNCGIGISIA